jgi:peptidoglycan lytic transglycosylase
MYVPATPVQPAPALAPVGVVSAAPATFGPPLASTLKLHREHLNVLESHSATVAGTLLEGHRPGLAGRRVALQSLVGRGWKTLATAHTSSRGRFRIAFRPRRLGSRLLRLRVAGDANATATHRRLGRLNVYRLAGASWYGGGGSTACGSHLTSSTLGVANKTLPCGTLVTLRYGGHSVRVPVIDRGPYVAGREFDLTEATKRALGFGDTGQVWSTG